VRITRNTDTDVIYLATASPGDVVISAAIQAPSGNEATPSAVPFNLPGDPIDNDLFESELKACEISVLVTEKDNPN
jgi:hypothetical protein